jgi:hypothetical protein
MFRHCSISHKHAAGVVRQPATGTWQNGWSFFGVGEFNGAGMMAQEFKPGQIVPQSGVYRIAHDPQHADMPHEVAVIKGRRFPTCRH